MKGRPIRKKELCFRKKVPTAIKKRFLILRLPLVVRKDRIFAKDLGEGEVDQWITKGDYIIKAGIYIFYFAPFRGGGQKYELLVDWGKNMMIY